MPLEQHVVRERADGARQLVLQRVPRRVQQQRLVRALELHWRAERRSRDQGVDVGRFISGLECKNQMK